MTAPDFIWLDWPDANRGDVVYDEPPERDTQPGQTAYVRRDPAVLTKLPEVQALIAAAVEDRDRSYIELHTTTFDVWKWFETARPDLIGPRATRLKDLLYGPRPYGDAMPDAKAALDRMLQAARTDERKKALREAASVAETEGVYPELNVWNGGPEWFKHGKRIASAIRALIQEPKP
jgi:hypothetical protein